MKTWPYPHPRDTAAAERARRYAKARETCKAPRGWEPWSPWEDILISDMVEGTKFSTVARMAWQLQRTENAILCRIEKKYGEQMRAHFTVPRVQFEKGCPKPPKPIKNDFGARLIDWWRRLDVATDSSAVVDELIRKENMPFGIGSPAWWQNDEREAEDARIFDEAVRTITRMGNCCPPSTPGFARRWVYRVTPNEYRAIGREIKRRKFLTKEDGEVTKSSGFRGYYTTTITLCGVRLTPNAESPAVLKDYGSSG